MKFYIGLHQPSDARHFERAFISINRVRKRKKPVGSREWILDSGAFRELEQFGNYRHSPEEYAAEVNRLAALNPGLIACVSQDWMCEPFILRKTGLTVEEHQRRTIERYDAISALVSIYVMPVLQGDMVWEYLANIDQYGDRLRPGMYVGVGSVCKRNTNPRYILAILSAIKARRPDLKLHGFGVKTTSLANAEIRALLESADSMAWSYHARKNGRHANAWEEAMRFVERIDALGDRNGRARVIYGELPSELLYAGSERVTHVRPS